MEVGWRVCDGSVVRSLLKAPWRCNLLFHSCNSKRTVHERFSVLITGSPALKNVLGVEKTPLPLHAVPMRGGGVYLQQEPIARGESVSIYLQQEPIPFLSGVSTWTRNQSHLRGGGYLPAPGTDRTKVGTYVGSRKNTVKIR